MTTEEMLFESFGRRLVVPVDDVRNCLFPELSFDTFRRELFSGKIDLPCITYRGSQKAGLFVDVRDLATWHDRRRDVASRDLDRIKIAA